MDDGGDGSDNGAGTEDGSGSGIILVLVCNIDNSGNGSDDETAAEDGGDSDNAGVGKDDGGGSNGDLVVVLKIWVMVVVMLRW